MNKKIKVIELLNNVFAKLNVPKKVRYRSEDYEYKEEYQDFYCYNTHEYLFCHAGGTVDKWLDAEVEILEDEKEIDINDLEDLPLNYKEVSELCDDETFVDFHNNTRAEINKIIKYLKQLDKKINKE